MTRKLLLWCGVLSSVLYVAIDVVGGLSYPGYHLSSQAISELTAVGAPSAALVAPLYLVYDLLVLAFGIGVLRTLVPRSRALRLTGGFLTAYGAIGFIIATGILGDEFFRMRLRGEGSLTTDAPHIILTGVFVLLLLLSIGAGSFVFGRRFRWYSLATILGMLGFGIATGIYAARLAAGLPTPGLGIFERIDVYLPMLWIGVLGIALLRRPGSARVRPEIGGSVAPGFEEVAREFERNFTQRGEIGAAVAAYWHGEKVVDLWGGYRTPERDALWDEDTMVVVMSTTKGLAAMTLAVANARGWIDYDAPVARYWPEFAQNGKADITVRQLLGHEAGLVFLDRKLSIAEQADLDFVREILARQRPEWKPGTQHGYHAMTVGLYMQELIRHADPQHRSLGRFFADEIARPLGLDFYIGLPAWVPDSRLAKFKPLSRWRALRALPNTPPALISKILAPNSLLRKSMAIHSDADFNERRSLAVELPAGNGVGTARAIARAYSAFAEGGAELGITPATFARLTALPDTSHARDVIIGLPAYYSLGFLRPGPEVTFGSSPRAFGTPGAGGSFGFADPDAHLGYAYVMNKLDFWLLDDPREKALREAMYRAIRRVGPRTGEHVAKRATAPIG